MPLPAAIRPRITLEQTAACLNELCAGWLQQRHRRRTGRNRLQRQSFISDYHERRNCLATRCRLRSYHESRGAL